MVTGTSDTNPAAASASRAARLDEQPGPDLVAAYLEAVMAILEDILSSQRPALEEAARLCAASIAEGGLVHVFGAGHSRIAVEELWPRYGSFPGFHPIVELSLTAHHQVTGANGQRQAMFIENVPGLAERILRNFRTGPADCLLAVSSGGTSVVTVEMAEAARRRQLPVIALTSLTHSRVAPPKAPSGRRLCEVADVVLDTCTPLGDAMVHVPGIAAPVGPSTTVAAAALVNALKVRVAERLAAVGALPPVLVSPVVAGEDDSRRSFDTAYDEHARRVARLGQW